MRVTEQLGVTYKERERERDEIGREFDNFSLGVQKNVFGAKEKKKRKTFCKHSGQNEEGNERVREREGGEREDREAK